MKPRRLAAFALVCALVAAPVLAESVGDAGVKRAVLIGINNYIALPSLMGSVNDVTTMREVLIKRWGFEPEHIALLTDQQATRANILAALNQIVHDAGPNDTVYIHYSGHGSQVQDLNGDEEDGLDETLVPQDGRTAGIRDIVDDELDELFDKFRARNVFIVLDSCHSGTATRSPDIRARSVPEDKRIDLYQQAPATHAIVPRMESHLIVMSAASSKEEALDGPIQGRYHGFFSYALANSLSNAAPDASPRQVLNGVVQELKRVQEQFGRLAMPEPQLEAPPALLDQPMLGRRSLKTDGAPAVTPRLVWADVRSSGSGELSLLNGALLGADIGSTWSIYPPNETLFAPGSAIGFAIVVRLTGKDAVATLSSKGMRIPAGARAVASMRSLGSSRVPIRIIAQSEVRRRQVQDLMTRSLPIADFVAQDAPARFIIDAGRPRLKLLTADGLQVVGEFDSGTEKWSTDAARVISRSVNASELLSLDNPASQLRVVANLASARQPATRDIVPAANTQPAVLRIRGAADPRTPGNSLQLAVSANRDAYITIVDVDTEGNVNLLFPNSLQRAGYLAQGLVRSGSVNLIPDSLAPANAAGFYWDYRPPKGVDTLRVFASTDLASADAIRHRIGTQTRGVAATATNVDAFAGLHDDLQKIETRGIQIEASEPSVAAAVQEMAPSAADWTATSLTIVIRD